MNWHSSSRASSVCQIIRNSNQWVVSAINLVLVVSLFCHQTTANAAIGSSGLPSEYLHIIPAKLGSKAAFAMLHDSGEMIMVPQMKLTSRGRLGNFNGVRLLHQNSNANMIVRWKAGGRKVQIKTNNRTKMAQTISNSTNDLTLNARYYLEAKKKSLKQKFTTNLDSHGAFYWETIAIMRALKSTLNEEGVFDPYSQRSSSLVRSTKERGPRNVSGSLNLGSAQSAKLAEGLWAISKGLGITLSVAGAAMGIAGVAAAASASAAILPGIAVVLGVAGFASNFYDLIKYTNPTAQSDTATGVFAVTDGAGLLNDAGELLLNFLKKGAGSLRSTNTVSIVQFVLEKLLEKPMHKVARGINLVILYTWPTEQKDLDTSTRFLGQSVGYGCGSSTQYLQWTGDDVGFGGMERVDCLISEAASDNALPPTFEVEARAGWFAPAGGSGPAYLQMYLNNPASGVLYGPSAMKTIAPGSQSGCSSTPVGGGSFTWNSFTNNLTWTLY
jgi:hypothetical protein